MSRTSYGVLAFKIPSGGLDGDALVKEHKECVKKMVAVLESYGGSLSTVAEVFAKSQTPEEDRLGDATIKEVTDES